MFQVVRDISLRFEQQLEDFVEYSLEASHVNILNNRRPINVRNTSLTTKTQKRFEIVENVFVFHLRI